MDEESDDNGGEIASAISLSVMCVPVYTMHVEHVDLDLEASRSSILQHTAEASNDDPRLPA